MKNNDLIPLAIHFIWNTEDAKIVDKILNTIKVNFARDINCPYSRGLNIPLFFYNNNDSKNSPNDIPLQKAQKDIVYLFLSKTTFIDEQYSDYIKNLSTEDNFKYLPIALDKEAILYGSIQSVLFGLNFVRIYEIDKDDDELFNKSILLKLSHELYRWGFGEIDKKKSCKDSSITLFLSHCKSGEIGKEIAQQIKKYIDNTNMNSFFDAIEISPAAEINEEIIINIKHSTILAIESDNYYSRYWCQKEILVAKKNKRPIIVIDCLDNFEDRIFPFGANVPCISITKNSSISEKDIINILLAALLETIRNEYSLIVLKYYQENKWIANDCELISRPPEAIQIKDWTERKIKKICYPEPPLYKEEVDYFVPKEIEVFTPLWDENASLDIFKDLRVGISISDCTLSSFSEFHLDSESLKRLSQDIARHLVARECTIIYGGDLRNDGFTNFILDEALVVNSRVKSEEKKVENHLAWPIYLNPDEKIKDWREKYFLVMKTIKNILPDDINKKIDNNKFLPPTTVDNKYIWSRSLTSMREISINSSDFRICAGGKLSSYKGKMPGVLEEIIISIEKDKPIFLLGAYGGVVGEVCNTILQHSITEPLTEKWQIEKNEDYFELQKKAKINNMHADYEKIKSKLENLDIQKLADKVGLQKEEYERLMFSPFSEECLHLILRGLRNKK